VDETEIAELVERAKVATEKFEAFFALFTMSTEQEKTLMTPRYFDLQRERDEAVAAVTRMRGGSSK
jgi:hypothetical protein